MQQSLSFSSYCQDLLNGLLASTTHDQAGQELDIEDAFDCLFQFLERLQEDRRKVMVIGNGGSASIAAHLQNDLVKANGLRAVCLTDLPLLTALTNDEGYDAAYARQISLHGDLGDLLIAISSSGQSENILNAVRAARANEMTVVTFSGFEPGNALRQLGHLNFFVPERSYGMVELAHSILCHYMTDALMNWSEKLDTHCRMETC